jgi:hypothetical protein
MVDDPHVAFQILCVLRDAHSLLWPQKINDILHVDVAPGVFAALWQFCVLSGMRQCYPLQLAGMHVMCDDTVDPDIGFRLKPLEVCMHGEGRLDRQVPTGQSLAPGQ